MTGPEYVTVTGYLFGLWVIGFGFGTLHRTYVQMIEKASLAD